MRDRSTWHRLLTGPLRPVWPQNLARFGPGDMLDVELGLYLLGKVMPKRAAADGWTLFGGYPYGEVFGDVDTDAQRLMIQRGRHYLWGMRRRRTWRLALEVYLTVPQGLRGYDLETLESVPQQREPSRADTRFDVYEQLLTSAPAFQRSPLPIAQVGEYWFPVRDRRLSVTFESDLVPRTQARPHDLATLPPGRGRPIEPTWQELSDAAARMDQIECGADPQAKHNDWAHRLGRVKLLVRDEARGRYTDSGTLRVDGLLNLVGMVGAGKSTLRDILTFWAATERGLRTTIVVGDVAETLAVVDLFNRLGVKAAPILGHTTREQHIRRLHRRLATGGAPTMLDHEHPGFTYANSACPLDALRGLDAARPLRIGEAPCVLLYPADKLPDQDTKSLLLAEEPAAAARTARDAKPARQGCPLWTDCPRHHGSRELVDAQVWVATPAGLVHSGLPQHQNEERLRYLELACRRSDLVIVDEADRVQMQLDTAFAPATTLVGQLPNSWLDEVAGHKINELARRGRLQLTDRDIDDWSNALNTVATAADRIYALLVQDPALRTWITQDYFSAFTLHQKLIIDWLPDLSSEESRAELAPADLDEQSRRQEHLDAVLDAFRDNPIQHQEPGEIPEPVRVLSDQLVHLTLELLHADQGATTRARLRRALLELVGNDPLIEASLDEHALRFEFTLLVAALHHCLDITTTLWPRVEAALNLETTSNVLSRRPPKDYEPVIPESPMGNVLGFQFQPGERDRDGEQSGELRFFRCNGVGRELLLNLGSLAQVDDRPPPHVLLMSATSWAGTSSRYHVHVPVGAVLRPHDEEARAVLDTTFRKEFLYWPTNNAAPLTLSGSDPERRAHVLKEMLRQLAEPDRTLTGATSKLQDELADIPDLQRRRILLLVGSYAEATIAADYLNSIPEWSGRITRLVSDDADLDDAWVRLPSDRSVRTLRRGDVATFPEGPGEILIAPLLAVERGHNIVVAGGKAAIGTAYFLARPHPRPDDIALAIQAINDWAVRQVRGDGFRHLALAQGTPDAAGQQFRSQARTQWNRFLTRRLSWSSLLPEEKTAFTWDQLVVMWQVIGRLVRGGVPARVVFVDAAFSPREARLQSSDTPATSLLMSLRTVLEPYFANSATTDPLDRSLVAALYEPLYRALRAMD